MKMKAYATFDQYLTDQPARNQRIIRVLRKFVKRAAPQLDESVKWGNGCWVKGKALWPTRILHATTFSSASFEALP